MGARRYLPLIRETSDIPLAVPSVVGIGLLAALRNREGEHFIVTDARRNVAVPGAPVHRSLHD